MVAGQYPGVRQYSANRGVGSSTASFENSKRRIVTTPMYCRIRNTPWFHPYCARLGRGYTYEGGFCTGAEVAGIGWQDLSISAMQMECSEHHEPRKLRQSFVPPYWMSLEHLSWTVLAFPPRHHI